MELILRIELKTSPLPRECSTAELYEHVFNNHKKQLMDLLKKISRYSNTKTDCRDDLLIIFAMLYIWSGWRESNPRHQLGRLRCYHYTTPAITLIQEDSNRESLSIKSMLGAMTNLKKYGGGRRIRTFEAFATELQSVGFDRSPIPPQVALNKNDFSLRQIHKKLL